MLNIILITHGVAGLGYLLLAAVLLTRWRSSAMGPAVLFACAATAIWALTVAMGSVLPRPPVAAIQILEVCKQGAWLFLILQLLSLQSSSNVWNWAGKRWVPAFAISAALGLGLIAARQVARTLSIDIPMLFDLVLAFLVFLAVMGLLLMEQLYRNASVEERWGLKFLCLGLGIICAYDLFMYAQALLFRQLDPVLWQARGVVHALVLPWLAVAIARSRNWRLDLHVSRHVVFHTVTLMGAGLYLLCMAVIGYFIKFLGGNWGGVLQVSFLAASGALLLTLLFSGTLRARLRVLLSKHFFSYRYDYRVEWLRFTEELAALENVPPGIIRTMATLALSPSGIMVYRGSAGQLTEVANWNLGTPPTLELAGLEKWIRQSGWVIDLREWRESPDLYGDLDLPTWVREHDALWLIVPLVFQGEVEGLLFLARTDLKDSVNWEDRDLLKTAGRQAAALLAQQRASSALVEARQFDAFNRLSAYVIHDLKNILAQQSLMVANARKHRDNPAFIDDMIGTVENSVKRMQRLMEQMRSGMRGLDTRTVDLAEILERAVAARSGLEPTPMLADIATARVIADRERLATVFGHLLQNAQDATDDNGEITVRMEFGDNDVRAVIKDSGSGMSETFIRERLFKPFESTKGLTGMGIGAFESREYVRQLGGDITVRSKPGEGSCFTVRLPLAVEDTSEQPPATAIADERECDADTPEPAGGVAQ